MSLKYQHFQKLTSGSSQLSSLGFSLGRTFLFLPISSSSRAAAAAAAISKILYWMSFINGVWKPTDNFYVDSIKFIEFVCISLEKCDKWNYINSFQNKKSTQQH